MDAIQCLGGIGFTASLADVVVAGGQKWLRAGWGSGLLALSPRSIEMLHPTLTGWWGVADAFDWDALPPHPARSDAEMFQDGSPPFFGAFAIAAEPCEVVFERSGATCTWSPDEGSVLDLAERNEVNSKI